MSWTPDQVLILTTTITTGVSGLGGVLLGGFLANRSQEKERNERATERLRDAYASWIAASEQLTKCDERSLGLLANAYELYSSDPVKRNEVMHSAWEKQTDAMAGEVSAFTRLALIEPDQTTVDRIDRIRQINPFEAATKDGKPNHDVFMQEWNRQFAEIASVIKDTNKKLSGKGV